MQNIELRWYRCVVVKDDKEVVEQRLQYRKYMATGAYAGLFGKPEGQPQWSDWQDVPVVYEGQK